MRDKGTIIECDVALIGAGIMSATLGAMLKDLEPGISIEVFERLDHAAAESSEAWNNAGTGHSAFCELNYTPEKEDGSIDISKAIRIAESFETSKQWWASLVEQGIIPCPKDFIRPISHDSFVWGPDNVAFLRKRYAAMTRSPLFEGMRYSEDKAELKDWMPLMMNGRDPNQQVAATRMDLGTDVNFGALTRALFGYLKKQPGVVLHFNQEVRDLEQQSDGRWYLRVKDHNTHQKSTIHAKFVFIGAGGGALPLLLKSDIPEGRGYGGFPVSGQWLRCTNPEVIRQHHAKVYGKAGVGAPPMSVPHLDARFIDGKPALLFGPYAGFSTKFLKQGSLMDLPRSIRFSNLGPLIMAGIHNFPLTRYLIRQVMQSNDDRMAALREFVPLAEEKDWELEIAGQRVQVIKHDEAEGGILEFGTEVVAAHDGSLAALLGASPGASTAVRIMLGLLQKCFPEKMAAGRWPERLHELIPSFGKSLNEDPELLAKLRAWTSGVLMGSKDC